MATDLDFLDEVTEFLALEAFASHKSLEDGLLKSSVVVETAKSLLPTDASSDDTDDSLKSERYSTRKSNRRSETPDMRRQKYRMRAKNERDGLRREAKELSTRIHDMISAREGRNTTARTDLVLSKTFWREAAIHQRDQRFLVEAEHKRLSAIVNAQSLYIESLGICQDSAELIPFPTLRDGYDGSIKQDQIDDIKWLRLKSSVCSLYSTYLQDVDKCYVQVDQIFQDIAMESLPMDSPDSSYIYKPNGDVEYFQHWNRQLLPLSFEDSSRAMWEFVLRPRHQIDREVFDGVSDPDNTVGLQFRRLITLASGKTMSIVKHLVCRRFIENDRVVIVWKIFSEGEGDSSGLDVDETRWVSIRPVYDGSQCKTLMEFYGRQIPVPYLTANANSTIGKDFLNVMQDGIAEDRQETIKLLEKRLLVTSEH